MYQPSGYGTLPEQRMISTALDQWGFNIPISIRDELVTSCLAILKDPKKDDIIKFKAMSNLLKMHDMNLTIIKAYIPRTTVHINVDQMSDADLNRELATVIDQLDITSTNELKTKLLGVA